MPRQYRETVMLPDELDLLALREVRSFIHRTIRVDCPTIRRAFKVKCERVQVDTSDSTIKEGSLDRALAVLEAGDEVETIHVAILTGRNDEAVALLWRRTGESHLEVAGARQTWVFGVSRTLELFIRRRGYELSAPTRGRWRLRGFSTSVALDALGTVAGTALLALIGALIAIVLR